MRRIHGDELAGHMWVVNSKGPGQDTAPIVSNDDGLLLSQPFNQSFNVSQQSGHIVTFARLVAIIVPAQVRRHDGKTVLSQEGYLVAPGVPELGEAVQEDDQRAAALGDVVQADAVADDVAMLPCFHCNCHVDVSSSKGKKGFTNARASTRHRPYYGRWEPQGWQRVLL